MNTDDEAEFEPLSEHEQANPSEGGWCSHGGDFEKTRFYALETPYR